MTNSSADRLFNAAEGIIGLRLPMPPPLDWINAYFLRDGEGWAMVDSGYNTPESREVLEDFIENHLGGLPITRVILTHYHPDHSGQAGWVCTRFKCPLIMTRTEYLLARWLSIDNSISYREMAADYYRATGTPEEMVHAVTDRGNNFLRVCDEMPASYIHIEEGDTIEIGGRKWEILIGRGHSPEMALLYCAADKLLIAGDQVVARITPNIGIWSFDTESNPLKEFLASCTDLPKTVPNDVTVLPGHGRPFENFHERVAAYNTFHENRLAKLLAGLTAQPQSLFSIVKILFPKELSPRDFVFALGETHSHINYLLATGQMQKVSNFSFKKI
jgi:glyoxylase-like metal-dependent hydrolase (beta-lactamase superfamily II)